MSGYKKFSTRYTAVDLSIEKGISLVGDKALRRKLIGLGTAAARFLRPGMTAGAKIAYKEAQRLVPVRTGTMKKAIKIRVKANRRKVSAAVFVDPNVQTVIKGKVYRPSKVARVVEYHYKSFLRAALANKQNEIRVVIEEKTREALDRFLQF